jgi:GT2 family glycosyltransferase
MFNLGIVILHYKNVYETEKCIESYLSQDCENINVKIVIVDNGSCNGTGAQLRDEYKNISFLYVDILDQNLGFAKGNNIGMKFLREKFSPDFIVYSNSDIELLNNQFYHWIIADYEQYGFGVLGPDIYSTTKKNHQSPTPNFSYRRAIERKFFNFSLYKKVKNRISPWEVDYKTITSKYTLHGALLIFSVKFFEAYPDGIYDKTFLYLEEAFLRFYCDEKNILMLYDGTYRVNHIQAASTSGNIDGEKERKKLRNKRFNRSLNLYLKLVGNVKKNNLISNLKTTITTCKLYRYLYSFSISPSDRAFYRSRFSIEVANRRHLKYNPESTDHSIRHSRVLYTCITGGYDTLLQPTYYNSEIDYICYTDNSDLINKKFYGVWQIRPLVYSKESNALNNRWHKLHPHILFPDYQDSIYIDGNIDVLDKFLFKKISLKPEALILIPKHSQRDCIYDEIAAVRNLKKADTVNVDKIAELLKETNFPHHYGLNENNIIYRKHNNESIIKMMDEWWEFVSQVVMRDQLSLIYVLWKNNIRPEDIALPSARNINHFHFYVTEKH